MTNNTPASEVPWTKGAWRTDTLYHSPQPGNARVVILAAPQNDLHLGTKIGEAAYSDEPSDYYVDSKAEAEANARIMSEAPTMAALLERLAAWEEKYPSSRVFSHGQILEIAEEIDAIANDARECLNRIRSVK